MQGLERKSSDEESPLEVESLDGKTSAEIYTLGARSFSTRKYAEAVFYLSKLSEMLVEEYKDHKHDELGKVYLMYGKSLLEVAREECDPLGDGVPKEVGFEDEEAETEEDEDDTFNKQSKEKADGAEAGADTISSTADVTSQKSSSEDESARDSGNNTAVSSTDDLLARSEKEGVADSVTDISMNGESAQSINEGDQDECSEDKDEENGEEHDSAAEETIDDTDDEPTDLQVAWEVLELAKIIFERRGAAGLEDYTDCLVALAEVALEGEGFESAIADITMALAIQKELYTKTEDMRKLAQTHYKLGMALAAHNKIEEGLTSYATTLRLLKERLSVLRGMIELGASDAAEAKDIEVVLAELEEKIADLKGYKAESTEVTDDEPTVSSPEKKVNNISHLVKRKRKLEDVAEEAIVKAVKKDPE